MIYNRLNLLILLCIGLNSCALIPSVHKGKPIHATVVEAKTGKPIEGAIVIVLWSLAGGLEGNMREVIDVQEAVTDQFGHFEVAGWSQRIVTKTLYRGTPYIYVLKENYSPGFFHNKKTLHGKVEIESEWNNLNLAINRRPEHFDKYEYLEKVDEILFFLGRLDKCSCTKIPKATALVVEAYKKGVPEIPDYTRWIENCSKGAQNSVSRTQNP